MQVKLSCFHNCNIVSVCVGISVCVFGGAAQKLRCLAVMSDSLSANQCQRNL